MRFLIILAVFSAVLNGITEEADETESESKTTLQNLTGANSLSSQSTTLVCMGHRFKGVKIEVGTDIYFRTRCY